MFFGVVKGTVVASQKTETLRGFSLKVLIPSDSKGQALPLPMGDAVVAVDSLGARTGDLVQWVAKREASMAIDAGPGGASVENMFPVDAAVTGIIDVVG